MRKFTSLVPNCIYDGGDNEFTGWLTKQGVQIIRIGNAEFAQMNLEEGDLMALGKFDAVFCSGLLYHLPEPWKLIEQLPAIAPKLFIWTHYATESEAQVLPDGRRGKIHFEDGPDEPLSGLSATATWLTLGSLISALTASGFKSVQIIDHDPGHPSAPAVTMGATLDEVPR